MLHTTMKSTYQKKETILLVDDEEDILEFLSYNLRKEGYKVYVADNGEDAIDIAPRIHPDLIILDIMMPKMDGLKVCRELRKNKALDDVYIAFLTARSEDYTQITGLEVGGDDYITKPVKPGVFNSRVRALLRRKNKSHEEELGKILTLGDLTIDKEKFIIEVKGKRVNLVKKEFELLYLLATKPGKVFNRAEILNNVWGAEVIVGDRTIDVHIRKLREKIGAQFIKTVKGIGYKLEF